MATCTSASCCMVGEGDRGGTTGGLEAFDLELFFAKHEFSARHLMCCSDAESMQVKDLVALADPECKTMWNELSCQYTESNGLPELRREIAKDYPGLAADDIFCFCGAEEGIYTAMRVLLTKQDNVIVVTPCYLSLRSVAAAVCDTVTCVDLKPQNGWQLDLRQLEAAVQPNTRMIVLNYPHNPTGALLSAADQAEVVALCRKHNLYLFFDEVYRGIEATGVKRLPTLASQYEKGLSLGVVSKSLGLAGLRIGWIACRDPLVIERLAGFKHYLSICNSAPSEVLALIALRNKTKILQRNAALTASNLALLSDFLADPAYSCIFKWEPPRGGCCGFMGFFPEGLPQHLKRIGRSSSAAGANRLASIAAADFDWESVSDALVHSFGVLTLPGKFLSPRTPNYFRVGLGRRSFPVALKAFQSAVDQLDWDAIAFKTFHTGTKDTLVPADKSRSHAKL